MKSLLRVRDRDFFVLCTVISLGTPTLCVEPVAAFGGKLICRVGGTHLFLPLLSKLCLESKVGAQRAPGLGMLRIPLLLTEEKLRGQ